MMTLDYCLMGLVDKERILLNMSFSYWTNKQTILLAIG